MIDVTVQIGCADNQNAVVTALHKIANLIAVMPDDAQQLDYASLDRRSITKAAVRPCVQVADSSGILFPELINRKIRCIVTPIELTLTDDASARYQKNHRADSIS